MYDLITGDPREQCENVEQRGNEGTKIFDPLQTPQHAGKPRVDR